MKSIYTSPWPRFGMSPEYDHELLTQRNGSLAAGKPGYRLSIIEDA